jgi:hypothetical protein
MPVFPFELQMLFDIIFLADELDDIPYQKFEWHIFLMIVLFADDLSIISKLFDAVLFDIRLSFDSFNEINETFVQKLLATVLLDDDLSNKIDELNKPWLFVIVLKDEL